MGIEFGQIIEAHSFKVSSGDSMLAELMAVKEAMLLSLKNDWKDIVCKSDAKNIIDCLNGGNSNRLHWTMDSVLKEILNLRCLFINVCFVWCNCNVNRRAHMVAKWVAKHEYTGFIRPEFYCVFF